MASKIKGTGDSELAGLLLDTPLAEAEGGSGSATSITTIQEVVTEDGDAATYTLPIAIPQDNTTPQSNEGAGLTNFDTLITPSKAGNKIIVEATIQVAYAASEQAFLTLFKNAETDAVKTSWQFSLNGAMVQLSIRYETVALDTSPITFKLRGGGHAGNTFWVNSNSGGNFFNGTMSSYIKVTEVTP